MVKSATKKFGNFTAVDNISFSGSNIAFLPVAFLVMALTALLFTAIGTAIASLLEDMQGFQMVMNFLVMPIFFLMDMFVVGG